MRELLSTLRENNIHLKLVAGELSVKYPKGAIDENILKEIRLRKADLISHLESLNKHEFLNIPVAEPRAQYVLSSAQKRLWVLSQFEEGNVAYNIPGVYVFEGDLDQEALSYSFNALVVRHESLRTVFREDGNGEVWQVIQSTEAAIFKIAYQDLSREDKPEQQLNTLIQQSMNALFDLSEGPLLRAGLYRLPANKWVLSYVMHHIISDGWSLGILIKELLQLYNARIAGAGNPLLPLRIQYKDYAAWQQGQLTGATSGSQQAYWLKQFEGVLPVLELAGDKPRPAVKTYHGGTVKSILDKAASKAIKALSGEQGGTLFMGLVAAVNVLLYRYANQEDIIIGTQVAGREHPDLENQIGFYNNTLALRTRFKGSDSFRELLKNIKQVTLEAYEHQAYPFDELVHALQVKHDMSRNPLFDVSVVLQNMEAGVTPEQGALGGVNVSAYDGSENLLSKFDLAFNFIEKGEEIEAGLVYNSDIYQQDTAVRMLLHLEQLLLAVIAQPSAGINELDYLSEEERHQLLVTFNDTAASYPADKTIVDLFREQVAATPDKIALVFEDKSWTYQELNDISDRLAHYLHVNYAVQPDDCIAIMLDTSAYLVVAILGILKAGAAYVPIDPQYPEARKEFILRDTGAQVLITQADFIFDLAYYSGRLFSIDVQLDVMDTPVQLELGKNDPSDLAYVMYTSGSMGQPKGVMVAHRSAVRLVKSADFIALTGDEVLLATGSVSFDATTFEYWSMLLNGGRLVLCSKEVLLDEQRLQSAIIKKGVNTMWFTAGWLHQLIDRNIAIFSGLKTILAGGDKLSPHHIHILRRHYPSLKIVNGYGPTENTTFSLCYDITAVADTIPVGRPIHNSTAYILDARQQLCAIGVPGEICVGGDGLARGYLNNPELTAAQFIPHPFKANSKIYRTGDLGRWMPDGNIAFIGRKDAQVKIRGFRIELGEIEVALQSHPEIDAAVVIARTPANGEKELVAYIISKEPLQASDLGVYLRNLLPVYMLPAHFVQLEQLPLNANGKVDKNSLPDPEGLGLRTGVEYIAARNETEEKLVLIWQEVLGRDKISVKDDFFDLGGHSLRATRLVSQVHKHFDVKVTLQDVFANTILEDQAQLIAGLRKTAFVGIAPVAIQPGYILSSSQRRLWILSQFEEVNISYNIPVAYVFEGNLDREALTHAFNTLIVRHEILRTVFKEDEQGAIRQVILSPELAVLSIAYHDLRHTAAQEVKVKALVQQDFITPFDLANGPLLRAALYQVADDKWIFSYAIHHIISDGWSMNILINELLLFYNAGTNGAAGQLPPLRIQYKDYAAWQQQQLSSESLQEHKSWWLKQFEGTLPVLELPGDHVRPALKTYNGGVIHTTINSRLSKDIKTISESMGATLFMGLLAAVKVLLYKYTSQEDIIIGSPIAGREHADVEDQIGFYVNTLALRTRFKGTDNFSELLANISQHTLQAYEHQVYPFDDLVDVLQLQRDTSRHPLFDVMVTLQNTGSDRVSGKKSTGALSISGYEGGAHVISKFDLAFTFVEIDETIHLSIAYNSDIYHAHTITQLSGHLEQLLAAIIAQPLTAIGQLEFLSVAEKQQLAGFNETAAACPEGKTIIGLFEEQAARTPGNIALVFEEKQLTYKELNEKANQLGNYLRRHYDIVADDLVGIKLERSEWMIIAILGVLKSGGAYVPVDPGYPQERIDYTLADSRCKVLIDENELQTFIKGEPFSKEDLLPVSGPAGLSYVIYTSGSTGKPKGVMVESLSVVNLITAQRAAFGITEEENILQFSNIAFDASVEQIFLALLSGARLRLINRETMLDPVKLEAFISENGITHIHTVPGILKTLRIKQYPSLKRVISGGDTCTQALAEEWSRYHDFYNEYGPTETTVTSTMLLYKPGGVQGPLSIGRPLSNTQVYILDEQLQQQPVGVTGEIYIGGDGVTRGYLHQPELTAAQFLPDPFRKGKRMYKTGDTGRWLRDGNIVFTGRKDDQVKIRGYRIEPGEIERALQDHPDIDAAVVVAKANAFGEQELIAYVSGKETLTTAAISAYLGTGLPAYMLPDHFVRMETLPLTHNGKVDRRNLPDPEGPGMLSGTAYVAPRNETEAQLVLAWQMVLGKNGIGIKDDFFRSGGHSLKATRLASLIHKQFNIKVALKDLFAHTILEEQAQLINRAAKHSFAEIVPVAIQPAYPLSSAQHRLWALSQSLEGNIGHNMPGVYVFEGNLDMVSLELAFMDLVARHESLRTVFKEDEQGVVWQFIYSPEEIACRLTYQDFSQADEKAEKVKAAVQKAFARPFNLSAGPLLRADVYQVSENKWVFAYVMHHIISDGWSMDILKNELLTLYSAYVKGEQRPLTPLRIQYKDYATWQQQQLSTDHLQYHKAYWLKQFEGALPVLALPADKARPAVKTYNGGLVNKRLNAGITKALRSFTQAQGATLFMGLLAVVKALLYRYTQQEDLVIGSPIAGRDHIDLEDQIGFYINTLALRTRFKGDAGFKELLENVRSVTMDAYEHQAYPFDELVEALKIRRDMSRYPLFDVWVVLQNQEKASATAEPDLQGLKVSEYEGLSSLVCRFDLLFNFMEVGEELYVGLRYNSDIYHERTALQLVNHFEQLLEAVMANASLPINQLEFLTARERHFLAVECNNMECEYPAHKTVAELFEEQVARTPDNVALIFENNQLTYAQLNESANRLAGYLRGKYHIRANDLVGIKLERSEWMMIAILGVLKSGGAYVPIDPEYPESRVEYMLSDSQCKMVIDETALQQFRTVENEYGTDNLVLINQPSSLAYVIYTSGSTGQPKGVMISNRSLVDYVYGILKKTNIKDCRSFGLVSTIAADLGNTVIYTALLTGGALHVFSAAAVMSPEIMHQVQVDCLKIVPSHWKALQRSGELFVPGKCLIFGGEQLTRDVVDIIKQHNGKCSVYNHYGPSETTIGKLSRYIDMTIPDPVISLGTPIGNNQVYILNDHQQLVPAGVAGEICIGGDGVSAGYLHKPELTAQKFIADPFRKGNRIYRSGDLGRVLPDSTIEFIGRKDDQVKIRGFRIELGEIESVLLRYNGITAAVVMAREDGKGDKNLVAYLVAKVGISIPDLRGWLSGSLPAYMVPAYFMNLEKLPLTANGKVDRRSLPSPEELNDERAAAYIAPGNEMEEKLVEIWSEVLEVEKEKIGIKDNFFELGGHSLKAIRIVLKIHEQFGIEIDLTNFFHEPNIEALATEMENILWVKDADDNVAVAEKKIVL